MSGFTAGRHPRDGDDRFASQRQRPPGHHCHPALETPFEHPEVHDGYPLSPAEREITRSAASEPSYTVDRYGSTFEMRGDGVWRRDGRPLYEGFWRGYAWGLATAVLAVAAGAAGFLL